MEAAPQLSFAEVLQNDYLALVAWVLPFSLWLLVLAVYLLPAWLNSQPVEISLAALLAVIGATLFAWLLLAWRFASLRALFAEGARLPGVVQQVRFVGSRGRVWLAYDFQGQHYTPRLAVIATPRSRRLAPGARVTLIIDPARPGQAIIQDVYRD